MHNIPNKRYFQKNLTVNDFKECDKFKTSKNFKTHEEQIAILNQKGVITNDHSLSILKRNNYYFLINRYKDIFLLNNNKPTIYKEGTHFDEFVAVYEFDRDLRDVILEYIIQIENIIKSIISYEFSKKYCHKYLSPDCFDTKNNSSFRAKEIRDLFSTISSAISRGINERKYIKHYHENYNEIPLWVIINDLSFGSTSKFYSLLRKEDKEQISNYFNIAYYELDTYLKVLTYFRNLAAHNQRIFDEKSPIIIKKNKFHSIDKTINEKESYLFSVLIIFRIMLEKKDYTQCYQKISNLIMKLESSLLSINIDFILQKMKMPSNFADLTKI